MAYSNPNTKFSGHIVNGKPLFIPTCGEERVNAFREKLAARARIASAKLKIRQNYLSEVIGIGYDICLAGNICRNGEIGMADFNQYSIILVDLSLWCR